MLRQNIFSCCCCCCCFSMKFDIDFCLCQHYFRVKTKFTAVLFFCHVKKLYVTIFMPFLALFLYAINSACFFYKNIKIQGSIHNILNFLWFETLESVLIRYSLVNFFFLNVVVVVVVVVVEKKS